MSQNHQLPHSTIFKKLSDDEIYEILSFQQNIKFLIFSCALVSKQWLNVISERCRISLTCENHIKLQGQFIKSISILKIEKKRRDFSIFNFSGMCNLRSLDLSDQNRITVDLVKQFTELKQLTILNLKGNMINEEIVEIISQLRQLTKLNISGCKINAEGVKLLVELNKLNELDIGGNNIGDLGAKYISQLSELTNLTVSYNNIGDEGANSIAKLKQLTKLDIRGNKIGEDETKHLTNELKQLKCLTISKYQMSEDGEYGYFTHQTFNDKNQQDSFHQCFLQR